MEKNKKKLLSIKINAIIYKECKIFLLALFVFNVLLLMLWWGNIREFFMYIGPVIETEGRILGSEPLKPSEKRGETTAEVFVVRFEYEALGRVHQGKSYVTARGDALDEYLKNIRLVIIQYPARRLGFARINGMRTTPYGILSRYSLLLSAGITSCMVYLFFTYLGIIKTKDQLMKELIPPDNTVDSPR